MTTQEAQKIMLISGTVTLGSTAIGRSLPTDMGGTGSLPPLRMFIGTLVAFTGISIISEFAPEVAAGLSAAIAGTAFITYGSDPLTKYFVQQKGTKTK